MGAFEKSRVRRTVLYLLECVLDLKKRRGRPGRSKRHDHDDLRGGESEVFERRAWCSCGRELPAINVGGLDERVDSRSTVAAGVKRVTDDLVAWTKVGG